MSLPHLSRTRKTTSARAPVSFIASSSRRSPMKSSRCAIHLPLIFRRSESGAWALSAFLLSALRAEQVLQSGTESWVDRRDSTSGGASLLPVCSLAYSASARARPSNHEDSNLLSRCSVSRSPQVALRC